MTALLRCFGFDFRYQGRHRVGAAKGSTGQHPRTLGEVSTHEWPIVRSPVPVVEDGL